jgi:hypothetical protein
MEQLVCGVKLESNQLKILSYLCDRLGMCHRPVSNTECANAAFIISQFTFTEKLFEKLFDKTESWRHALEQYQPGESGLFLEVRLHFLVIENKVKLMLNSENEALKRRFKSFSMRVRQNLTDDVIALALTDFDWDN